MRHHGARIFSLLACLLPPAAQAALTPVGEPFAVADESPCSSVATVEVTATPKGAFEVMWTDTLEPQVLGRRYDRALNPGGPPVTLFPLPPSGGIFKADITGTWAGRYELGMNVVDYGADLLDPWAAYRVALDLDGDPVEPAVRLKPQRFAEIAPAAGGDSLQFRYDPPYKGQCRGGGLRVSRIDENGAPLSRESRITRRAPSWSRSALVTDRLPDDTFITVYSTCQEFRGLVARHLSPSGVPVGKAIPLPIPGGLVGSFNSSAVALASRSGSDFAVAATVISPKGESGAGYTRAVVNGRVFGPTRIPVPASATGISGVIDLAASPDGGYVLLFQGDAGSQRLLFAQELDARGVPQGEAVQLTGDEEYGAHGAVASLPDGRWIVVTRAQHAEAEVCTERLVGTVLGN